MAGYGPIPKRDEERIRRNKPETPTTKVEAIGEVKIPTLRIHNARGIVKDIYESFKNSAQTRYYEPSDWEMLRLNLILLDQQLKAGRANGQIMATIMSQFASLLATEGDRRRIRMEIERNTEDNDAKVFDVAQMFLDRQNNAQ